VRTTTLVSDPLDGITGDLRVPVQRAVEVLAGEDRVGVAFSGGVDSSVLLALAARTLGADRVIAILGVSPSLAARERAEAHDVAAAVGVPIVEVETREGDRLEYRANGPDRCFHCKDELFTRIDDDLVARHRLSAVAYGENADDARRVDRPGSAAATYHRVLRPLADAGLDKGAVRSLARHWGLATADKPAAPCLASRIPHGAEVTPEKLRQVEAAEDALHALGLGEFRVRHHGDVARLELPVSVLERVLGEPLRSRVQAAVRAAGFRYATVDLAGLQSGKFTLTALQHHVRG
jgi:pyridinium-3,5-biscarboxylic acid mononucleotide sulfurtransferase